MVSDDIPGFVYNVGNLNLQLFTNKSVKMFTLNKLCMLLQIK